MAITAKSDPRVTAYLPIMFNMTAFACLGAG
jgi:hypothetical protein